MLMIPRSPPKKNGSYEPQALFRSLKRLGALAGAGRVTSFQVEPASVVLNSNTPAFTPLQSPVSQPWVASVKCMAFLEQDWMPPSLYGSRMRVQLAPPSVEW